MADCPEEMSSSYDLQSNNWNWNTSNRSSWDTPPANKSIWQTHCSSKGSELIDTPATSTSKWNTASEYNDKHEWQLGEARRGLSQISDFFDSIRDTIGHVPFHLSNACSAIEALLDIFEDKCQSATWAEHENAAKDAEVDDLVTQLKELEDQIEAFGKLNSEYGVEQGRGFGIVHKSPPVSILQGLPIDKEGKVLNDDGDAVGEVTWGNKSRISQLKYTCNEWGQIFNKAHDLIGTAQTLPVVKSQQYEQMPNSINEKLQDLRNSIASELGMSKALHERLQTVETRLQGKTLHSDKTKDEMAVLLGRIKNLEDFRAKQLLSPRSITRRVKDLASDVGSLRCDVNINRIELKDEIEFLKSKMALVTSKLSSNRSHSFSKEALLAKPARAVVNSPIEMPWITELGKRAMSPMNSMAANVEAVTDEWDKLRSTKLAVSEGSTELERKSWGFPSMEESFDKQNGVLDPPDDGIQWPDKWPETSATSSSWTTDSGKKDSNKEISGKKISTGDGIWVRNPFGRQSLIPASHRTSEFLW